ncbi:hypothetical protein [Nonomuraea roseoviolacea]|uniref:Uncharacterized protein n=1 Tax=Nonomuraea roseoviolacea subsp. carminata TaxID=160689 RepID=A0ABT1JWG6_9ACTN|nr:hypothetical protein [Nonomuraea roseoviolacea]MCP2345139.1 hypothetical protein [Nonomuraea roseoviolacea subsp. carminata]
MKLPLMNPGTKPTTAEQAAQWLAYALSEMGVPAEVNGNAHVALVSVYINLVVWTNGAHFSWWNGSYSKFAGRRVYAYCPADDPLTAARRVILRLESLKQESDGGTL